MGRRRPGFFLPVRVLSRLFRRLFLEELRAAYDEGRLGFFGELAYLAKPDAFVCLLAEVRRYQWVVYAKPPFGDRKHCSLSDGSRHPGSVFHRTILRCRRIVNALHQPGTDDPGRSSRLQSP